MPQTTTALASVAANVNVGGLGPPAWAQPNQALTDNAQNATVSTSLLGGASQELRLTAFGLLAGEAAGGGLTGIQIPAEASIVGVRFTFDVTTGANASMTYGARSGAGTGQTGTLAASQAQGLRTLGFGTLSAGSTVAGGNTWQGNDLTTTAGATAARATLSNANLQVYVVGAASSNALAAATYGVDYVQVTVQWVIYADRVGGPKGTTRAAALPKAQVSRQTVGGKSTTKVASQPLTMVQRATAGAAATGAQGGAVASVVTLPHPVGGKAQATNAGAPSTVVTKAPSGAKAQLTVGGVARVFTASIAGTTRDRATGAPVGGVRVDVYRFSDHQHMGRVFSSTDSGSVGRYTLAIPKLGNEGQTFWVRSKQEGAPNRMGTTDDDLVLIESLVQGPEL